MPAFFKKLLFARAKATMEVVAEAGVNTTIEEARGYFAKADTELNEERLEAIAGGLLQMPFVTGDDTLT